MKNKKMENIINKLLDSALNDAESALKNKKGLNNDLVCKNYYHSMGVYHGICSVLEKISIDKYIKRFENDRLRMYDILQKADTLNL